AEAAAAAKPLARFFDGDGYSVVAGRAALLARAAEPADGVRRAAQAGASAVLLDGPVPAGALGLDERVSAPVVGLPPTAARAARTALARGAEVRVALGRVTWDENATRSRIAPFSSRGLSFGGGVKPELVGPGVELLTADSGRNPDRTPRFATLSGASAAAAVVGGAAALVAQARPNLDAAGLKSVLVGTASPLREAPAAAQGTGLADPAAGVVAEVAARPAAIAFGAADKSGWSSKRRLQVTNVTNRRVTVTIDAGAEGIAGVRVVAEPARLVLAAGERLPVQLTARVSFVPRGAGAISGTIRLGSTGGLVLRVPWAVALPSAGTPLLHSVRISPQAFSASDSAPAVVSVRAGGLTTDGGLPQLQPLARLDVDLWRGTERLGLLARLRDVLPGNYAFGITGRGPRGGALGHGAYRLRVVAVPPAGDTQATWVPFRIR
ncbi:MAG TPA: S8 family serine peptidase, partial [Gaiellaceae bacterium]|nr:S8 family serine peptidase [Gaiellaceae bacterium]